MATLKVFDPPMCCSTGVCGVTADTKLAQLAADLAYLKEQGVLVLRYNLRDDVKEFADHPKVLSEMGEENQYLPIFMINDQILSKATYPTREQLTGWLGVAAAAKPAQSSSCCGPSGCCG
jgi:hypothetical protein